MISIYIYLICRYIWLQKENALIIKNKYIFYFLQLTWGLLINIVGAITTILLILITHKAPKRQGLCFYFELNTNWGLNLGMFIFGHKNCLKHEHGHAFQNAIFGPFFITVVTIPSVLRFWHRRIIKCINPKTKLPLYDSIWFEGQATKSGTEYFKKEGI